MRPRFSLRTFLIVVALFGVILIPAANFVYRIRRQRAAILKLEAAGAILSRAERAYGQGKLVRYRNEEPSLVKNFARDYIDELAYEPHHVVVLSTGPALLDVQTAQERLAAVRDLYGVRAVGLNVEHFNRTMFDHLSALPELHSITLKYDSIDPEVIPLFAKWNRIDELYLESPISNELATSIARMPLLKEAMFDLSSLSVQAAQTLGAAPKLELVVLPKGTKVTGGEFFTAWGEAGVARKLILQQNHLDEDATAAIAHLQSLREFFMSSKSKASPKLTSFIGKLTSLENLTIQLHAEAPVQKQCEEIAQLTNLTRLAIGGCDMTPEGLSALKPLASLKYVHYRGKLPDDLIEQFLQNGPAACSVNQTEDSKPGQPSTYYKLENGTLQVRKNP